MNRLGALRRAADIDIFEMADLVGVDVVELALAERGLGLAHLDLITSVTNVLECSPDAAYPALAGHFDPLEDETLDEDDLRFVMLSDEHRPVLRAAGIDPDIARWYAIVKLNSGNERRYRMSSGECDRIRSELMHSESTDGFLVFTADCRTVAIRKSAISEMTFRNNASYAPFSSVESACHVVLVSPRSPRPETIAVSPDGGEDGDGPRPFASFIEAAAEGGPMMSFLLMDDDGDERFLSIDLMETIEIPLSVLMPELLMGDQPSAHPDAASGLEDMEVMGQA